MQAQRRLIVVGLVVVLQLWWAGKQLEMRVDAAAIKGCGEACERNEDCRGSLFCAEEGVCTDDPHLGTSVCAGEQTKDKAHHKGCRAKSFLIGSQHSCNRDLQAQCCRTDTRYPRFRCSPKVSARTLANLTVNNFGQGGDGGSASACDGKFHSASEKVVALSTGWFNHGNRCNKKIRIFVDDKSVEATVVDECDSFNGCDNVHSFQPPCNFDTVDASLAVWEALGISKHDPKFGFTQVHWTDA